MTAHAHRQYWLLKSEPSEVSIDDLEKATGQVLPWFGVRNFQARNFMRDVMRLGDQAFFYHAGCSVPGIAGLCEICSESHADATQFDPASPYFDAQSTPQNPRWLLRSVRFIRKTTYVPLAILRQAPELANMRLLARGNRLSITPVTENEWQFITQNLMAER